MSASAVTKNSETIKDTISHDLLTGFAKKKCVILMLALSSLCEGTKHVRLSIPRNPCFLKFY